MKTLLALLTLLVLGCSPVDREPEEYIDLSLVPPPASTVAEEIIATPEATVEVPPVAPVDKRPEVFVYSMDPVENCPPCVKLKKEVSELSSEELADLPFRFNFDTPAPGWVELFPTLHWETPEGWAKIEGWNGLDDFMKAYRKPLSSKKKDGITSQSELSTEINSSISSSASGQKSEGPAEQTQLSQQDTGSNSSYRKRRR